MTTQQLEGALGFIIGALICSLFANWVQYTITTKYEWISVSTTEGYVGGLIDKQDVKLLDQDHREVYIYNQTEVNTDTIKTITIR